METTGDDDRNQPARLSRRAITLPALLTLGEAPTAAQIKPGSLKVVCVGGHPDDPESGCGGTLALYAAQGHRVTIVYLTITAAREKKKSALFAHKCQQGDGIYREHHEIMENFRGREVRAAAAEAFALLPSPKGSQKLPGS